VKEVCFEAGVKELGRVVDGERGESTDAGRGKLEMESLE